MCSSRGRRTASVSQQRRRRAPPPRAGAGSAAAALTDDVAAVLAAVSQSFFRDEAAAAALSLDAVDATVPFEQSRPQLCAGAPNGGSSSGDNDRNINSTDDDDASDGMAALILLDWHSSGRAASPPPALAEAAPPLVASLGPSRHLSCRADDVAFNLGQVLSLAGGGGSGGGGDHRVAGAAELLLQGIDAKAILPDNALVGTRLERTCLSQADFSFTSFEAVEAAHCDFSLCVFYKATFCGACTFRGCDFDGSVLTGASLLGATFVDCTFRRASLGVVYGEPQGRGAAGPEGDAVFIACDFDLATFEQCEGLAQHPGAFLRCRNTDTAAKFPLRAHAV